MKTRKLVIIIPLCCNTKIFQINTIKMFLFLVMFCWTCIYQVRARIAFLQFRSSISKGLDGFTQFCIHNFLQPIISFPYIYVAHYSLVFIFLFIIQYSLYFLPINIMFYDLTPQIIFYPIFVWPIFICILLTLSWPLFMESRLTSLSL